MKRIISIMLVLFLFSFSSGHALPHSYTDHNQRLSRYHAATAKTHPHYLAKVEAVKNHQKSRIPVYVFGSFYGACPTDTLWAEAIVRDPAQMTEIYAENRIEKSLSAEPVQVAFSIEEGEILFSGATQLGNYKADPAQHSVIRVAATENGPRVPALTTLNEAGMALQATAGCIGCHSS